MPGNWLYLGAAALTCERDRAWNLCRANVAGSIRLHYHHIGASSSVIVVEDNDEYWRVLVRIAPTGSPRQ